jgi:hypothetical protein
LFFTDWPKLTVGVETTRLSRTDGDSSLSLGAVSRDCPHKVELPKTKTTAKAMAKELPLKLVCIIDLFREVWNDKTARNKLESTRLFELEDDKAESVDE